MSIIEISCNLTFNRFHALHPLFPSELKKLSFFFIFSYYYLLFDVFHFCKKNQIKSKQKMLKRNFHFPSLNKCIYLPDLKIKTQNIFSSFLFFFSLLELIVNWDFNESHSSRLKFFLTKLLCSLGDISSLLYVNPSPATSVKENLSSSVFLGWYANLSVISPTYTLNAFLSCVQL